MLIKLNEFKVDLKRTSEGRHCPSDRDAHAPIQHLRTFYYSKKLKKNSESWEKGS